MAVYVKTGEIGVEIGDNENSNPDFKPLSVTLRGRWSANNVPRGTTARHSPLLRLPDLPGMYLFLNVEARTARVVDPLQYEDNASIKLAWREYQDGLEPLPEQKIEKMTDGDVASWVYWIGRLIEKGEATKLDGSAELPDIDDIPGDPVISPFNARFGQPRTLGEMELFLRHTNLFDRLRRELQEESAPTRQ